MGLIEIGILGIGLAMDAVAVSMTNGMVFKNLGIKEYIMMTLFFGIFQGIMPVAGYFAGTFFADLITKYSGIIILIILGAIGINMIRESLSSKNEVYDDKKVLSIGVIFFQAIATSIDAFAVGVGFCAVNVKIIPASLIIALITMIMVIVAIWIGRQFGNIFERKAELLGGIILIIIGVKAIL